MVDLKLPTKLYNLLFQKQEFASDVISNLKDLLHILKNNNLFFFPEYTDHSIIHINGVLSSIERLITDDTFDKLLPDDIGVLVTAVVLHDIGMLTNADMFKNIIEGKYDNIPENWFKDEPTWKELWKDYVKESQYWNTEKRENVTGDSNYVAKVTENDLNDETDEKTITYKISHPLKLEGEDRRFIGEFIRRHHARLAYEIALKGYIGKTTSNFKNERLPRNFMQLAGLIARSHGMNVRDTFDILEKKIGRASWKYPNNVKVILLMTLVRIADYLQIDSERTDQIMLDQRTMYSKYSFREHKTHLSITCIQKDDDDPEQIVVQAIPDDAQMFEKIERLIKDIQHEFDLSWAYLGEVYGNRYQLRYRRIITNISDDEVKKDYTFVPNLFGFKFNNKLFELLIDPLYGNNPSYGVRELVQNAVDACRTRMALDKEYDAKENFTHVTVSLDPETKLFRIVDTGIGMNSEEIEKYFLTIGSSYSSSIDWKNTRDVYNRKTDNNENHETYRTGKFGIGILAAFLLGPIIKVKTKRYNGKQGYQFTLRLDKDFIQIDKVDLPNYGTTIEIECDENALKRLLQDVPDDWDYLCSDKWFGWYVDSKPKVEYIHKGQPILLKKDYINSFRLLPTKSMNFGDIYWNPRCIFESHDDSIKTYFRSTGRPVLICNGFCVTNSSNITTFHIPGIDEYLPLGIPDLMVVDTYNYLPLNLNRTNIGYNVEYEFEKDLAIAMCKDFLSQILTIDLYSVKGALIIYNQLGYAFNNQMSFSEETVRNKCLYGNYLVRFYSFLIKRNGKRTKHISHYDFFGLLRLTIMNHSDAFFNFVSYFDFNPGFFADKIYDFESDDSGCIVVNTSLFKNSFKRDISKRAKRVYGDYTILGNDAVNINLVNDLVLQINSLDLKDTLIYFTIEHIKDKDVYSSLDDFINDYAGGDMIIPYDENERRKKFAKLYTECRDEIERYRAYYQDDRFK